jgi:hypothetical protein
MKLLTQRNFETKAGQEQIISAIHNLQRRVHELENSVELLSQQEARLEHELQEPETY